MNSNNRYESNTEEREPRKSNQPPAAGGRGQLQTKRESWNSNSHKAAYEPQFQEISNDSPQNSNRPPDPDYARKKNEDMIAKCYPPHPRRRMEVCKTPPPWQNGKYIRDDCGSGIIPNRMTYNASRQNWCRTPLTSYQASHGELARQILCGEKVIERSIESGPPCNVCEYVLPLCRGYYRKYECEKAPCEEEYWSYKKRPRDKVEKYWEPCASTYERIDVNNFAPHNVALGSHLKKRDRTTCW